MSLDRKQTNESLRTTPSKRLTNCATRLSGTTNRNKEGVGRLVNAYRLLCQIAEEKEAFDIKGYAIVLAKNLSTVTHMCLAMPADTAKKLSRAGRA
jgi:hypothetical protein